MKESNDVNQEDTEETQDDPSESVSKEVPTPECLGQNESYQLRSRHHLQKPKRYEINIT